MNDPLPYVTVIVVAVLLVLLVLERFIPLRRPTRPWMGRLIVNLLITTLAFAAAYFLVRPAASAMLRRNVENPIGLLHLFPLPAWAQFLGGFLLMDLAFYYWHRANHRFAFLWRFHNVHHIDPDLDVSTGFRFHFAEVAFSAGFRIVQVTAIGVMPLTFAVYEVVFQANTLFHHSNLKLPVRLERVLNYFLVTPRMHGVHHSHVHAETDSNYFVVFPWWDRLHRTLRLNVRQARITIGVPGYGDAADNRTWTALLMPFRKQRDYWIGPDGAKITRKAEDTDGPPTRMAE